MTWSNQQIARVLREFGLFLEMREIPFKPRAYEKAAQAVEVCETPLAKLHEEGGVRALMTVPGVGRGIAERLDELLRTGRIGDLERMRGETPVDVLELTSIEGVGPRKVKALHDELGIRTLADLERAAREGRVHGIPHFRERTEARILHGIDLRRKAGGRVPLGTVLPIALEIEGRLAGLPGVRRAVVAGSVRRRSETIGDLDFLVVARRPDEVSRYFATMPEVASVHATGPTKTLVRLSLGFDADLRVVPSESFGAALCYFTGCKAHNIALRRIARQRGLKLSEYGLFRGARRIAGSTEKEVYEALGLQLVPPEMREDRGEIETARQGRLPRLIQIGDLRGDLQVQTSWTDGGCSIEEMAVAARGLGMEYIAITDHTRDLAMTRGLDEVRLREQTEAIRALDARLEGIRVLSGAEVNIRRDGTLDISDEALARLDVVGAAVHSLLRIGREEMTRRVVRAMENPHVDIIFHPTCRIIGRREPIEIDLDEVLAAARRTGTALEIDAQPDRLDLCDEHVRRAVAAGVKLVIDSDAHHTTHLRFAREFGVPVARRGWARRADVLNTLPLAALRRALKDGRSRGRGGSPPIGKTYARHGGGRKDSRKELS